MAQHVSYVRQALVNIIWYVEIPDDVPEDEWEDYVEGVIDVYDTDEDECELVEYTDNKWFDK